MWQLKGAQLLLTVLLLLADFKPSNLLVMANGRVVVSDFDISTDQLSANRTITCHGFAGTVGYRAPDNTPSKAADMFSFGVTLAEIVAGKLPTEADLEKLRCKEWPFEQAVDKHMLNLMPLLLTKVPGHRLTAIDMLRTAYFTSAFPQLPSLPVPSNWTSGDGVLIVSDQSVLSTLNRCIQPKPGWFGVGADWKDKFPGDCSGLKLAKAWRIQDSHQWTAFANERARVAQLMESVDRVALEDGFAQATASLPGATEMNSAINEVHLLHGTAPITVLNILKQGLNERFAGSHAGSAYGEGTYFAENTGK